MLDGVLVMEIPAELGADSRTSLLATLTNTRINLKVTGLSIKEDEFLLYSFLELCPLVLTKRLSGTSYSFFATNTGDVYYFLLVDNGLNVAELVLIGSRL